MKLVIYVILVLNLICIPTAAFAKDITISAPGLTRKEIIEPLKTYIKKNYNNFLIGSTVRYVDYVQKDKYDIVILVSLIGKAKKIGDPAYKITDFYYVILQLDNDNSTDFNQRLVAYNAGKFTNYDDVAKTIVLSMYNNLILKE